MRLQINKACDLSSISVLPPHCRRPNRSSFDAADSSVLGKMQPSQQSFSQGMSLSQNSFDDVLTNVQRLGSQERDQSTKRICSLPPITASREDSQMPTRRSNNMIQRWSSSSIAERRCQITEELEHKFGMVENSLSRFGRMLDCIQCDAIQINKTLKEVMLEVESIRQKTVANENSLLLVLKAEEDIKSSIERSYKSCFERKNEPDKSSFQEIISLLSNLPDKIESMMSTLHTELLNIITREMKNPDRDRSSFQEIHSLLSTLAVQIESRIPILHRELSTIITKEMKVMMDGWGPHCSMPPTSLLPSMTNNYGSVICKNNLPVPAQVSTHPVMDNKRAFCAPKRKNDRDILRQMNEQKQSSGPKPEVILLTEQNDEGQVVVDLDEEMDSGFSCLFDENQTVFAVGKGYMEEANEETMRILKRARRRKRKSSNNVTGI